MQFLHSILSILTLFSLCVAGIDFENADVKKSSYEYQSDVARLRKIVINSLYSHRDIFIRELISNANDALEKLRLLSLTDKSIWDGSTPLNMTIKTVPGKDGSPSKVIITDTGIGMSPEELATNLGTLAKSGTAEFLARAESADTTGTGNLIGAFGLGFYSSFLVADQVYVSSIPYKSDQNPNPVQHVFSSNSEESVFEVFPDPRGNTLERGTEITLVLKNEAEEFVDTVTLAQLINKHSSFASGFPIYLYKQVNKEVPEEEEEKPSETPLTPDLPISDDGDIDEAMIEEIIQKELPKPKKMKTVVVDEWDHLNAQPPLWQRDPKDITPVEYGLFYQATFKHFVDPLSWHHFSGDADGVRFKGIVYLPPQLEDSYWAGSQNSPKSDIRLMAKRVFVTSNLGEMPKWADWVKAVVDADDLPLNVSRETIQSTRFLKQIKQVILKHLIQLFTRLATEDQEKFANLQKSFGNIFKLGAVEDTKNREKLAALTRFSTNQRNSTSLDEYLENKKQGQKQIFYLAELGKPIHELANSVFVEKLHARGYEVLLLNEALDEVMFQNIRQWKKFPFQDVAKAGLKFGDEEEEKEQQQELAERFKPLLDWLKVQAKDVVRDVVISNRLVTSPCAVVADTFGSTANIEKLMSATNYNKNKDSMHELAKKQKFLEVNPRSPLIEGLLRRIEQLPSEEEGKDVEAEEELEEVASILIDGALVRSGFGVPDSNRFFVRVDKVLRRSLGVSEDAPTDTNVVPAPPVDPTMPEDVEGGGDAPFILSDGPPDDLAANFSLTMEDVRKLRKDEPVEAVHDEL